MKNAKESQRIRAILRQQRTFFQTGETRRLHCRIQSLNLLENALKMHKDAILEALREDLHKPTFEAYLAEYYFLLQEVRLAKKSLKEWMLPRRVASPIYMQPSKSEVHREPYGVVLIVAPWNYPIQLSLAPLISALAAGNTVVLKPSEHAPKSETLLVHLLEEIFSPSLVSVCTGDAAVSAALLEEDFDFIFFTGSTEIGKKVAMRAAARLIPCVLELGGKCPCIVEDSADIPLAASRILNGKLFNAGQTCFAPDFVIVHESIEGDLLEALEAELRSVPWHEEMAHVVNRFHHQRLMNLLDGVEGERVITVGEDDEKVGKLAPRVVSACEWGEALLQEEIFGPILPIVSYHSERALLERLSQYGDPLALYLFSEDAEFCQRVQDAKRSGGVCINDTMKQSMSLNLPFGGVGESGHGRYRGVYGFEAFTYQRAVVKRGKLGSKWLDLKPPYAVVWRWVEKWMR